MGQLSDKQKKALQQMQRAITALSKAEIDISIMDNSIIYCTLSMLEDYPEYKKKTYGGAPDLLRATHQGIIEDDDRVGTLNRNGLRIDGGGW